MNILVGSNDRQPYQGLMTMIKDREEVSSKSAIKSQYFSFNHFHGINDFLFLALGVLLLFLGISLFSYSPHDNALFVFHSGKTAFQNVCGAVGAYGADILLFCLGACAHAWLACVIAAWTWRGLLRQTKVHVGSFVSSTLVFGVFLSLAFRFFAACGVGSYSLTIGNSVFASVLHAIGPVGVGLLVGTGLFSAICFLFDVTAYQAVIAKLLLLKKTLQATVVLSRKSVHVARYALQLAGELVVYIKNTLATAEAHEDDQKIMRMVFEERVVEQKTVREEVSKSFAPFESTEFSIDVDVHDQDAAECVAENLYVPDISRSFKFGSVSLRLLPVLPKHTHVFHHAEIYRLVRGAVLPQSAVASTQPFPLPDDSLLTEEHVQVFDRQVFEAECKARGVQLEEKLRHFGIKGSVVAIKPGPVITIFEYQPDIDVKINSIIAREDDLAMVLKALSIRIVAPIPGTSVVGFEIANTQREDVFISDLIGTESWKKSSAHLPLLLGVDSTGNAVVQDLATMPHLLVAGSTGSGKSVCMHTLLFSLLSRHTPETLRFVLIDPKRLEFAAYAEIPHLLFPIVVEAQRAIAVLKWVVAEMEHRYKTMAQACVRNIAEYNKRTQEKGGPLLPYLVVMIDELADLMIVAGKEIELQLIRIAQMARAAGIHVVLATQRPSVDVVTGLIKVNFPSRLACRVSSKVDSRTILDAGGAEKLLGRGDMLFLHGSAASLRRIHGAYVSESQVLRLTNYLRALGKPVYVDLEMYADANKPSGYDGNEEDVLYGEVLQAIKTMDDVSISLLQRRFRIGFNRAARLIEQLEADGLLAPAQGSKPRKVLRM